ncbi:MAG: glycogen/starch/alpha-glucan phosphorylase [Rhizobiaceae bacterium]
MSYENPLSAEEFRDSILHHLTYTLGKDAGHAQIYDWRMALSYATRDQIVDSWFRSTRATYAQAGKRVYYLSMEFLIGRLLKDALVNLRLDERAQTVLRELGIDYDTVLADEPDAALGNGGLGRLAACFLESLSTLSCPAYGYGIRYEHGLFRQSFVEGRQVEAPETWLQQKHAWEFERPEAAFEIGFGGRVIETGSHAIWKPAQSVMAAAYDTPIVGWQAHWANTLRLWSAEPVNEFDLERFNRGEYAAAAEHEALARTISRVLYPDDTTEAGKELRLKQEYFFTAASLRDILRRFDSEYDDLHKLPVKVAIQLNDTHPAIAGPELVRILHDERGLEFSNAVEITRNCLSYTNHTLLPEALERWPESLMSRLLPRHMTIIERINEAHMAAYPKPKVTALESGEVKMGELSFMMAHKVNGVSALHTSLMKSTVFKDLHQLHPDRIINQTNGVTPRRWLLSCNQRLSDLISETIGTQWVSDLEQLRKLEQFVEDDTFMDRFADVKKANKTELAEWISENHDLDIDPDAMFDIQIKRIHEYKRQHLNILETIALWLEIKDNPNGDWTPRVKIFGGKAAPGYFFAKDIIRLINDVSAVLNADPMTNRFLKVIFIPNYNVTLAERLIPAADLSEQISTAGKEASGTGNMKFALNGALTVGTLDGANVEIRERVGPENFFLFGMKADEVIKLREKPNHAAAAIAADSRLANAVEAIRSGKFSPEEPARYHGIVENLTTSDYFMVCSDFADFWRAQRQVDKAYLDKSRWNRSALLNVARTGWFSSDRTIRDYMDQIWNARPLKA